MPPKKATSSAKASGTKAKTGAKTRDTKTTKKNVEKEAKPEENEVKPTTTRKRKKAEPVTESKEEAAPKIRKNKGKTVKSADIESKEENEGEHLGNVVDVKKGQKRKAATKKEPKLEHSEAKAPKNATITNWESINFKCTSKSPKGKAPNFHITTWNVGGLRSWLKKGCLDILQYDQPDILCIQETKCSLDKLPEEVKTIKGYETLWCSSDKDGYAGVGIIVKDKPINVIYGIESKEHDTEGRCITVEYETFYIVNVYVPNAGRKLVTLPKRLDWNEEFKKFIKKLDSQKPVIICGDMNVAHTEIDLANPKTNTKNAGFTIEERDGMTDFLANGFVDIFRHLYPDKEKTYTFWTYMGNARGKNVGWRLDYFLISSRFVDNVCDNLIHSEVLGSDHCPLSLHLQI
ncbi:DNA-(apurinic or apyrimidinic site) endonuclease isoform X2 [Tribolium madens]|uniref:DNA-(apurinic or apyrimidinic site) endonuclease isoform X2 n=1 Tax=Tribolium madens TaxID=41895 RepID=UPI001CF75B60|nr:DNA-(apurinic or apyrimidinic site) endonuclease isoform X2 [Tribolium madens]